jgi:OmpA-OmpF porin, OOP family
MRSTGGGFSRLSRIAIVSALIAAECSGCSLTLQPDPLPLASVAGTCLTDKAAPLALVIGARSNVPDPSLPALVSSLLEVMAGDGQQISLIVIEGQPKITVLPLFHTTDQNAVAQRNDLLSYLNYYINPILEGKIHAQVAQADVLSALDLAAAVTGPDGDIIVVDSGLQTVAPLEYQQQGLLMAPSSDVVTFLREQDLLPDLSGRHVLLSGFGYTAAPQPPLDKAQQDNVIDQWTAIIKAGGACVTADPTPNTESEIAGLPPVSIVAPPATPVFTNCGTIELSDSGSIGFIVGTATLRDASTAGTVLRQLAVKLKQGTEHIMLIGSTSSEGGDTVNDALSLARAEAVEKILVSLGIAASRITSVGDGSHYPGRVPDIGPGGLLLPAQAEQDREVIVQLPECK